MNLNQLAPINKLIENIKIGNNDTAESGISMSPGTSMEMTKEMFNVLGNVMILKSQLVKGNLITEARRAESNTHKIL